LEHTIRTTYLLQVEGREHGHERAMDSTPGRASARQPVRPLKRSRKETTGGFNETPGVGKKLTQKPQTLGVGESFDANANGSQSLRDFSVRRAAPACPLPSDRFDIDRTKAFEDAGSPCSRPRLSIGSATGAPRAPRPASAIEVARVPGLGQELTLVHFSAQLEPFLTPTLSPKRRNISSNPAIHTP